MTGIMGRSARRTQAAACAKLTPAAPLGRPCCNRPVAGWTMSPGSDTLQQAELGGCLCSTSSSTCRAMCLALLRAALCCTSIALGAVPLNAMEGHVWWWTHCFHRFDLATVLCTVWLWVVLCRPLCRLISILMCAAAADASRCINLNAVMPKIWLMAPAWWWRPMFVSDLGGLLPAGSSLSFRHPLTVMHHFYQPIQGRIGSHDAPVAACGCREHVPLVFRRTLPGLNWLGSKSAAKPPLSRLAHQLPCGGP